MADHDHSLPFAPNKIHQRSDEEIATFKALRKERSGKCFVYVFAGIVILCLLTLVFALIVLRFRFPDVNLSSVAVKNLRLSNVGTASSSNSSFSATLVAEVTIKNTNFGRFNFENSTMSVLYGGMNVGDIRIGRWSVKARETRKMNVAVEVRSNRLSDTKNLSSDMMSGMLKLNSYASLSGRVNLLNIIKKRKIAEMNCTMTLNLTSGAIEDLQC